MENSEYYKLGAEEACDDVSANQSRRHQTRRGDNQFKEILACLLLA